jgi:D-alanine-D-alanine ligase
LQGALDIRGIPYTGSSLLASALSMDKSRAKDLFRLHNLPTPAYACADSESDPTKRAAGLGYPVIVKPAAGGSSLGVSVCHSADELAEAWSAARSYGTHIVIEKFIVGMDVTVAVVNNRALGAIEVVPTHQLYGYIDKHIMNDALLPRSFIPPRLTPHMHQVVLRTALRAHRVLGCEGATCVDLRVTSGGCEYILEVNTVPALHPHALLPKIAASTGMSFGQLCEEMLADALRPVRFAATRQYSQSMMDVHCAH